MSRRRAVVTAAILVGALGLTACGTNREEGGGAAAGACDTSKGTLVVGMVAPLSGPLSALGLGMQNSADLAVDQANQKCTVPGYALRLQAEDDQSMPAIAANAATRLASDANVVGVIGTLNSSTAQTVQPILLERGIVQISPANTGNILTQGEDFLNNPVRNFPNYFRVSTVDSLQGPFGARYLVETAGKRNIAVIDDGKTYGAGLAAAFAAEAERLGATIVAREKVGELDTDFSGVITTIRALNPDAVYYGGEYPAAGPLSAQLAQGGLDIPLMGGDAIQNAEYVPLGGRPGDLVTVPGAPPAELESAQQFIADYEAANYVEGYETYGAFTYDATNILIASTAAAIGDGEWSEESRPTVIENVQATNVEGSSGPISFDEFGDTTNKVLTVYIVEGDAQVPLQSGTFEAS